jgi:hypothetical protein
MAGEEASRLGTRPRGPDIGSPHQPGARVRATRAGLPPAGLDVEPDSGVRAAQGRLRGSRPRVPRCAQTQLRRRRPSASLPATTPQTGDQGGNDASPVGRPARRRDRRVSASWCGADYRALVESPAAGDDALSASRASEVIDDPVSTRKQLLRRAPPGRRAFSLDWQGRKLPYHR